MGEYLGVLMVGPVVVFSALGMTATVLNSEIVTRIQELEPFGFLLYGVTRLVPYALIVGMFTFMYAYIPNTRVRLKAAVLGGLAAGVLWQSASLGFASFVAGATNYNAIYSGFAILIFLLIWLYVGWLILLTGCQFAFYVQHPMHMKPDRSLPQAGSREVEFTALMVMATAGRRFIDGQPALTQEDMARELAATPERVARAVETLIEQGFLTEAGQARTQLVPARDLESVSLGALWQAVRRGNAALPGQPPLGRRVLGLLDDAELGFVERHGDTSLRQWLRDMA
jgi:membrane protein